jgi:glycosyltransferase involved in cell wall biosynthesis
VKILYISSSVNPVGSGRYGGLEKSLLDFALRMKELGHDVTIASVIGSKIPEGIKHIPTVDARINQDRDDLAYYNYVPYVKEFEVIHDFSHRKILANLDSEKKYPTVNMVWNVGFEVQRLPKYNLMCLSKFIAEKVANMYYQAVKYEDLPIDCSKYAFCKDKEDYFVFAGSMIPKKNALEAIKICRELGVKLHVMGGINPRDDKSYMYEVIKNCDDKQIFWHGDVTEEVKIELLQHAKALIYPIRYDHAQETAFSLLIPEANSCGTPCVVYGWGCFPELIIDGKTGFLPQTYKEFKEAMLKVDEIKPEDCRDFAVKRFHRDRVVNSYLEEVYKPVAEGLRW